MTEAETDHTRPRGRRWRRALAAAILAAGAAVAVGAALVGRPIALPEAITERIEAAVNAGAPGTPVSIGAVELIVGRDGATRTLLRNVSVSGAGGVPLAAFARVRAELAPSAMIERRLAPARVAVEGVEITLRRLRDGSLAVVGGSGAPGRPDDALSRLAEALHRPPFDHLDELALEDVTLTLEDARSGRVWQATGGEAMVRRAGAGLTLSLGADVFNGTDRLSRVELSFDYAGPGLPAALGARLVDMNAGDIALQTPSLSWLAALDAPISGAVRARLSGEGRIAGLDGTLEIGAGALRPGGGGAPLGFDAARAYMGFDPDAGRIALREFAVSSETLSLEGQGQVLLDEMTEGWPGAFLGQITLDRLRLAPGLTPEAVGLTAARADLRLRLDPFAVEFAEIAVAEGALTGRATGHARATRDGWEVALDARAPRLEADRLLGFWPERLATGARGWLVRNVERATLRDASVALRWRSDERPRIAASFAMTDARFRVLPEMPPVEGGSGAGSIIDGRLGLHLARGRMETPAGPLDVSGSSFAIRDTRQKPSRAEARLAASGPVAAGLWVADRPPIRALSRAGREPDIATGAMTLTGEVTFPLKRGIAPDEVGYRIAAELTDLRSDAAVPGRELVAEAMRLSVDPDALRLSGAAALDGVPLDLVWNQPLGPEAGAGTVTGSVTVTDANLRRLGVTLPEGMVAGRGRGDFTLEMGRGGAAPRLLARSDLRGLTLDGASFGWRKPAGTPGALEVAVTLGDAPQVTRLALDAPGLSLTGRVDLAGGTARAILLDRVSLNGWLDAALTLTPRGAGRAPAVRVRGGRLDLRRIEGLGGGAGGSGGGPIDVALDRVTVTDGIALTGVRGQVVPRDGGLDGRVAARMGGRTPVDIRLSPVSGGTAVRLAAADAGAALRDAGLIKTAEGGRLDLLLTPDARAEGLYDGEFLIESVRLRKAPVMADLLDAISVVGLIDQLQGPGILFDTVDGRFRLGPRALRLSEAAAIGGSLGVSASGVYDIAAKRMDFRGVISPIYFLNGIGSILTRRGEGLFGFNYRLSGAVEAPRVGVNPLSILTPGGLREILRSGTPGQ